MDDNKLLKDIGDLIDTKLQPIKKQLGALDVKVDSLDSKVGALDVKVETLDLKIETVNAKVDRLATNLSKKIKQAQEETIEVLSELITAGYDLHEKRIKRVEDHLHLPQIQ